MTQQVQDAMSQKKTNLTLETVSVRRRLGSCSLDRYQHIAEMPWLTRRQDEIGLTALKLVEQRKGKNIGWLIKPTLITVGLAQRSVVEQVHTNHRRAREPFGGHNSLGQLL